MKNKHCFPKFGIKNGDTESFTSKEEAQKMLVGPSEQTKLNLLVLEEDFQEGGILVRRISLDEVRK